MDQHPLHDLDRGLHRKVQPFPMGSQVIHLTQKLALIKTGAVWRDRLAVMHHQPLRKSGLELLDAAIRVLADADLARRNPGLGCDNIEKMAAHQSI